MCFVTEKTMAYCSRLSRMFWNNYLRLCQSHLVRDLNDSYLHVGENKQIKTQISKSTTVSQEECVNVLLRVFLTTEPIVFNRLLELTPRSDFDIGLSRDKTESVMRWNHRLSIGGMLNLWWNTLVGKSSALIDRSTGVERHENFTFSYASFAVSPKFLFSPILDGWKMGGVQERFQCDWMSCMAACQNILPPNAIVFSVNRHIFTFFKLSEKNILV